MTLDRWISVAGIGWLSGWIVLLCTAPILGVRHAFVLGVATAVAVTYKIGRAERSDPTDEEA